MTINTWIAAGIVALLLIVGIAWAGGLFGSGEVDVKNDEQLAPLQEKNEKLRSEEGRKLPQAERDKLREDIRKEVESLPEEKRQALRNYNRQQMFTEMQKRMDDYFALPRENRTAAMDKIIDEMEQRRGEWERRRQQEGTSANRGTAATGRGGPAAGDGSRPRQPPTEQQRQEWRKRMLDRTTPEMRAKFTEFRRDINERRKERGLPEMTGFGGRGRRGPG